jgi:hypothetical protein
MHGALASKKYDFARRLLREKIARRLLAQPGCF